MPIHSADEHGDEPLAKAESYLRQGRFAEALAICQQEVKQHPDNAAIYQSMGRALAGLGQIAAAEKAYIRAIDMQPHAVEAYYSLGALKMEQRQYAAAIPYFEQVVARKPMMAEAYCQIGVALFKQDLRDEAIAPFARAIAAHPNYAEAHFNLGNIYLGQGKLQEAEDYLRQAVALQPTFMEARLRLSHALTRQGNLEGAEVCLLQGLSPASHPPEISCELGYLQLKQKKFDAAIAFFQKAIARKNDLVEALFGLGVAHLEQDDLAPAYAFFLKVLELQPGVAEAHGSAGFILCKQGKYEEGVVYLKRAIELKPDYCEAYANLSSALVRQNRYEEAIDCALRGLELQPNQVELFQNLAISNTNLHRPEEALSWYQKILEQSPEDYKALCNLGVLFFSLDRLDEASQFLIKALYLKPDFGDAYWNLRSVFSKRSQYHLGRSLGEQYLQYCAEEDGIRAKVAYISAYLASGYKPAFQDLEEKVYREAGQMSLREVNTLYLSFLFGLPHLRDDPDRNSQFFKLVGGLYVEQRLKAFPLVSTPKKAVSESKRLPPYRIGFLSANFKRHSVGWCCIDAICELAKITPHIFLYATDNLLRDDRTEIVARVAEKFFFPSRVAHTQEIYEEILRDRLDVLIDLDSITVPGNIEILYHRPAPICLSWMGFDAPFISQDNYFLGDIHTRPPGIESNYVERLVRMPDALAAVAGFDCEDTSRAERLQALGIDPDAFVYLSVAPGTKFTMEMARAQVQILREVPQSVLIYKLLGDTEVMQAAYRRECEAQGVDFSRLHSVVGMERPEEKHRTIYKTADVLLDSYPMNGGTYTLEALWFELPIVTLVGKQYCSRMGYSFLKTLGVEHGIAWTWDDYIAWGIRFGCDRGLHQSVRQRLAEAKQAERLSPLWDPAKFARDLYAIFADLLKEKRPNP